MLKGLLWGNHQHTSRARSVSRRLVGDCTPVDLGPAVSFRGQTGQAPSRPRHGDGNARQADSPRPKD